MQWNQGNREALFTKSVKGLKAEGEPENSSVISALENSDPRVRCRLQHLMQFLGYPPDPLERPPAMEKNPKYNAPLYNRQILTKSFNNNTKQQPSTN